MEEDPRYAPVSRPPPLRTEARSLYAYAESNPSPILITDTEGKKRYANGAWEQMTGYSSEEVCGKTPRFLNSGKTSPELFKQLWEALREGKSFESEDFIDKRKDGTEFSIHSVFFPVKIRGITYFVQEMQDISRRKEIEKRRDAFISTASHEMRNPLSSIMYSMELLRHDLGSIPNAAQKTFQTLQDEAGRFKELLNYLLDINKIQTGVLVIHKKEYELRALIERTIAELQPTHPSHTLVLEPGAPVVAMCDEARVAEVLVNLLSNAGKYSPQADRVVIRAYQDGDMAVVSVQDYGLGIAQAEQKKVFDILYRAQNKGTVEGTGLGLYVSAQIIQAHGGTLWLESELGKGSTFYFSLPLR